MIIVHMLCFGVPFLMFYSQFNSISVEHQEKEDQKAPWTCQSWTWSYRWVKSKNFFILNCLQFWGYVPLIHDCYEPLQASTVSILEVAVTLVVCITIVSTSTNTIQVISAKLEWEISIWEKIRNSAQPSDWTNCGHWLATKPAKNAAKTRKAKFQLSTWSNS